MEWVWWAGKGTAAGSNRVRGVRMEAPLMRGAQPIRLNYGPAHAMDEFRQWLERQEGERIGGRRRLGGREGGGKERGRERGRT